MSLLPPRLLDRHRRGTSITVQYLLPAISDDVSFRNVRRCSFSFRRLRGFKYYKRSLCSALSIQIIDQSPQDFPFDQSSQFAEPVEDVTSGPFVLDPWYPLFCIPGFHLTMWSTAREIAEGDVVIVWLVSTSISR